MWGLMISCVGPGFLVFKIKIFYADFKKNPGWGCRAPYDHDTVCYKLWGQIFEDLGFLARYDQFSYKGIC